MLCDVFYCNIYIVEGHTAQLVFGVVLLPSLGGCSLGNFSPGQMVPAFDKVCFSAATKLEEVVGPIQTQFGYHLIIVDSREGPLPKTCEARHILVKNLCLTSTSYIVWPHYIYIYSGATQCN